MSRTINPTLQARLDTGTTTLCHITTITRKDGTVLRFTDNDEDVVVSGDTYIRDDSLALSGITSSANGGIQSTNCAIIFSDTGISEIDVVRGVYDDATLEFAVVDYTDTALGKYILLTGTMSTISGTNRGYGHCEVRGLLTQGDARIGEYYSAECRADLGDARCGVSLASFSTTATVTEVTTQTKIKVTLGTGAVDGFYTFGVLTFTSGANDGLSMEILNQFDAGAGEDSLFLSLQLPFTIEVGDTLDLVAGCDKRLATCISKFNNFLNFRGEPYVPGPDFVSDFVTSRK